MALERLSGEVRITVARGSAWRWPLGGAARNCLAAAAFGAVLLAAGLAAAVAVAGDPWSLRNWFFTIFGSGIGAVAAVYSVNEGRRTLRGQTVYALRAAGVWQSGPSGEGAVFTPWAEAVPRPRHLSVGATPRDPAALAWPGHRSARGVVPPGVRFDALGGAQVRWMDRAVRRATRGMRAAALGRKVGGGTGGRLICFDRLGSVQVRALVRAAAAVADLVALGTAHLVARYGDVRDSADVNGAVLAGAGVAAIAAGLIAAPWPLVRRERLLLTRGAVRVETGRFLGGWKRRRAFAEDVAAVSVGGRRVSIRCLGGVGRSGATLAFRAPRGWSPGPLADEVRQGLGLRRVERGFPVVVY